MANISPVFFKENHIRPVITFVSDRSGKVDGRRIK